MTDGRVLKEEAIPLYYQLEVSLRSRLAEGEFAPGDGFPSEAAIGAEYNVSRITVRQALASLERDGLIHRQRGRGGLCHRHGPAVVDPQADRGPGRRDHVRPGRQV